MENNSKVKRNWIFDCVLFILFFVLLELIAGVYLKSLYFEDGLAADSHPILSPDPDLRYRLRTHPFQSDTDFFMVDSPTGNRFAGKFSFDSKEGMIRNAYGDFVLNRWGLRGPDFELKRSKRTVRIAALGGSTTAGDHENELTYPRILERMLNSKKSKLRNFQVINAGHWSYNSCQVKTIFLRDILPLHPDIALIMSGLNDSNLLRVAEIKNQDQYCLSPHSFFEKSSFFRLFKHLVKAFVEKRALGYKIYPKNLEFYKNNLQTIVDIAKTKGTKIIFVTLPGVYEEGTSPVELKKLPQLSNLNKNDIDLYRKVSLKANNVMRELAEENGNAFFSHSGVSVKALGKQNFFADPVHPNGEGNRILAYGIYKTINRELNLKNTSESPFTYNSIPPNQLEIEYLKSLFESYEIEDLSFSGCVAFHEKCTHKKLILIDQQYATSVISLTLGSILLFKNQLHETQQIFKRLLDNVEKTQPSFSLLHWVKGEWLRSLGETQLAMESLQKAYRLNPLLEGFSFDEHYFNFWKQHQPNVLATDLKKILNTLERAPNYIAPYAYFWSLSKKTIKQEDLQNNLSLYLSLYYSSPLLARSIFSDAMEYFVATKQKNRGLMFTRVLKTMKPEYQFDRIFFEFEEKFLK